MKPPSGRATALLRRAIRQYEAGQFEAALEQCSRAIEVDRTLVEAYRVTGAVCVQLQRPETAVNALAIATALDPLDAAAHSNLGVALRALGRHDEARSSIETALRLDPAAPQIWFNLAILLVDSGQWTDAVSVYRRVLQADPGHLGAHAGLANVLHYLGRLPQAEQCARAALALAPQAATLHGCLALPLLAQGALREGWQEYEWRWDTPGAVPRRYADRPRWQGEALNGEVLLLHAEQGFGDTLQFCRYAALIEGASRIVIEVPPSLVTLLTTLHPSVDILPTGVAPPPFDKQCPLMSLPGCCRTWTLDDIPASTPYLHPDPAKVAFWRERLAGAQGMRVGLCWAGGEKSDIHARLVDGRRSMSLAQFAPFGALEGAAFVSLQKDGPAAGEALAPPPGLALVDWTAELADFADTAALITALDLVVTVDTAVAHLAGALGKPVWLLNRFDSDWRWLQDRDDSPWYPSLRQFRQSRPGVWSDVVQRVCEALALRVRAAGVPSPL
jgi:Flp pilus assembly protein TadD